MGVTKSRQLIGATTAEHEPLGAQTLQRVLQLRDIDVFDTQAPFRQATQHSLLVR